MAASIISTVAEAIKNPSTVTESKTSKKKKARSQAERTESPVPTATLTPDQQASGGGNDQEDDSPYVRELRKSIRNVNKKIANASKTDSLIASHPDKSLDELVAAKIINADQKAQVLKKPGLQAQLAQLQEQLTQYLKVDQEYRGRLASEKAAFEKSLTEKLEKEHQAELAKFKEESEKSTSKTLHDNLLVLSQFLRLAAARRAEEADSQADENLALEGVLLNVYSGDENAVATMLKLVQGVEEPTRSTSGETLKTTYAQVKASAAAYGLLFQQPETEVPESAEAPAEEPKETPVSDPTIAHAGLTEIDEGSTKPFANGHSEEAPTAVTSAADVADNAANAAAENQWDADNSANNLAESQEWVNIPRDPAETETGVAATPAAPANTQSWADDHPEPTAETAAPAAPEGDGFQAVHRHRGRGDREGSFQGRGGGRGGRGGERGGYRGRGGFRGDGRGRGRGGERGAYRGRGGPRREGAPAAEAA
ncbi:Transcription factor CBF NF-Y histone domain-containing protein [Coniochaeta hoffmannii]|uniref:Transcription factor CBF NF-Y histone domain-containing protein n=1 Tax=Coniochaeta hoffmannii TaxID=91930 RepID=A0AA38RVX7_9PEZI|nr:Transcription factor CBF NF-Y histone domain-containing protein [Coniochaeta hoffmannii]